MPGPPPKQNARRRNYRPDWRQLPAAGRPGDPPEFPLGRMSVKLQVLWLDLWKAPQSVAWEELGWTRLVARYARLVIEAEKPDAFVGLLGEVRQLEDRLGLSPMAMKRLQWEIVGTVESVSGPSEGENVTSIDEYRQRFG